jgi:PIN domain nuclease of toxin-antitoxin system
VKLLLDTHIWLWSLVAPGRLSRRVARALEDADNELWLSPVSTWELCVLVERGRVALKTDVATWVAEAFRRVPLHEAPLTHEVALATASIRLPHRDPADRFLAATAEIFELTLVTADERLTGARHVRTFANR